MSNESVCQVARSWVDVGSFHARLFIIFMNFTASFRNILDIPSYTGRRWTVLHTAHTFCHIPCLPFALSRIRGSVRVRGQTKMLMWFQRQPIRTPTYMVRDVKLIASLHLVYNEWSYTSTPPVCQHGVDRDDLTFSTLLLRRVRKIAKSYC
jgi:hypothetical protein